MLPYCFSKSSNAKRSCVRVKSLIKGNLADVGDGGDEYPVRMIPTNGLKGKYDHKETTQGTRVFPAERSRIH